MLRQLTPMLGVSDVQTSLEFYADALGFRETGRFEHDGDLCWAHIESGGTCLMLTRLDNLKSGSLGRKQMFLYFYPDDVAELHGALAAKGYQTTELRQTVYHMKEFELEDPDGYQLWFGQDSDQQANCQ